MSYTENNTMARNGKADDAEIRFDAPILDVRVLDGFCSGVGTSRTDAMRMILNTWAEKELHKARVILRVAGGNPTVADNVRQESGE